MANSGTDASPQFDQIAAAVFINKGPYFDGLNKKDFYTHLLGIPMSFEIHQSINGMFRYGYIIFEDKVGIRETLPLTGNEILTIRYANGTSGSEFSRQPRVIHFNVFDIEETQFSGNAQDRFTQKALKFHIIEAPFFLKYNTNVWMKSYGTPDSEVSIDTIFNKHLTQDLQIPGELFTLNLQKMSSSMHFCTPAWRSQMIFNYLLQYARDENGYGNVKFYNTSDPKTGSVIVNLQSINQMFKNKNATEFSLIDTSALGSGKTSVARISQRNINLITNYKFVSYDLTSLASGLPGAHLLNFDYQNSQYYTLRDNYTESNSRKENPFFYNFALWSDQISSDQSKRLFIGPVNKELAKSYLNNKIMDHKFQLRCETVTYIDENINPGDKVVIYFMSGMADVNQQHLLDEQMSGAWIVEDLVDASLNGIGYRKMVLVKDSFFNLYDPNSGTSNNKGLPEVKAIFGPKG